MARKTTKPATGRPRKKPIEGERNHLGMRTTAELKSRLENEATKSGRSLSQEAEYRLERSFWDDEKRQMEMLREFGGPQNLALAKVVARMATVMGDLSWSRWSENPEIFMEFRRAVNLFLDALAPPAAREGSEGAGGLLKHLIGPEHQADPGKAFADAWLEQITAASEGDPIDTSKGDSHTKDQIIAYEVAPALAPLIGRKETENEFCDSHLCTRGNRHGFGQPPVRNR